MKKLKDFLAFVVVIIIGWLVINILFLIWDYMNLEGFTGFYHIFEIIRSSLITFLGIIIWIFVLVYFFPKKVTKKAIGKFAIALFIPPIITLVNLLQFSAAGVYFSGKLSDRYKYIEQSEDYFEEGRLEDALDYAKTAHDNLKNKKSRNALLVLSNLYLNSEAAEKDRLSALYAAKLNYGICTIRHGKDLAFAQKLFKSSLEIAPKFAPNDSIYKLLPVINLSDIELQKGNLNGAHSYFNRAKLISMKITDKNDVWSVIALYKTFSKYYERIGNFVPAVKLHLESLRIFENKYPESTSNSKFFLQLDVCKGLLSVGDINGAGEILSKLVEIADENDDKLFNYQEFLRIKSIYYEYLANSNNVTKSIIGEGLISKLKHKAQGDKNYSRKELLNVSYESLLQAYDEVEDKLSEEHLLAIQIKLQMVHFNIKKGNLIDAQRHLERVIETMKTTSFDVSNSYLESLLLSAIIYSKLDKGEYVNGIISNIEEHVKQQKELNFILLSPDEQETFIVNINKYLNHVNSIHFKHNNIESIYNNILHSKAAAFRSARGVNKVIRDKFKDKFQEIQLLKQRVDILNASNSPIKDVLQLQEEIRLNLNVISKEIQQKTPKKNTTWENVKKSLDSSQAAIEIVKLPVHGAFNKFDYFAIGITGNSKKPFGMRLGSEDSLKIIFLSENRNQIQHSLKVNREKIYNFIWKPIKEKIGYCSSIYLSPSGLFHSIPYSAVMPNEDIRIVNSTGDLLVSNIDSLNISKAILIGDIKYDSLNIRQSNQSYRSGNIKPLPFTKIEIDSIQKIIQRMGGKVFYYTQDKASESWIKSYKMDSIDLIHIATHAGYEKFKLDSTGNKVHYNVQTKQDQILSGSKLAFAGCNNRDDFNPLSDGFLSAKEISQLDFSNVKLVVLSACETGKGGIIDGEGVYGFARSCKLAGAKSVLVTLWEVPDESTSKLMSRFYFHLMNGVTPLEALKQAQQDIKRIPEFSDYLYWAGFKIIN